MSDQRCDDDAQLMVGAKHARAGTEPGDGRPDSRVGLARRVVASYPDYRGAERAVQRLSDTEFPVEQTAITGSGLTLVEKVTGRVSAATVAARSAASGAIVGALLGWLLGLFDLMDPLVAALWLALYGAVLGAAVGVGVGLLGSALTRGRRGFTTTGRVRAQWYDVTADAESADRAVRILRETSPS